MSAGCASLRGFMRDTAEPTGRIRLAETLERYRASGARTLAISAEPAPYCLPPVDLFRWEIRLVPRGFSSSEMANAADISARAVDSYRPHAWGEIRGSPVSWADKPFAVDVHKFERDEDSPMNLLGNPGSYGILSRMEGVTTAIVAFIFVCIIYPHLVKNRPQFYAALGAILLLIFLNTLQLMIGNVKFSIVVAVFDGLLQIGAILLLVLSAGGLTVSDLTQRHRQDHRRGPPDGEKETIIVPIRGEQPKPRQDSSLPLE